MARRQIGVDASRCLRPRPTGTENYARHILSALLALDEAAAYEWVLYVDREPDARQFSWTQAPHATVRVLPRVRLWTHRALAREIRRRPPDLLFVPAHVLPFAGVSGAQPPAVMTVHDLGYEYFPEAHTPLQRFYLQWSTRYAVRRAARLICVSEATRTDLIRLYGARESKLDVVYEGDVRRRGPVADSAGRAQHSALGVTCPYMLFLSTVQPRKNVERLIRSYTRLVQTQALELDLVVAGQLGWLSETIVRTARRAPAADRIHLLGYVDEDAAAALYAGATFFCYPSLHEGFGLPILEAQSAGVPVMTSRRSALPEVAGDAALLVNPEDEEEIAAAMLRLSNDETLRQELIRKGYENVKRFSWPKAARETLAVLQKAMDPDP